MTTTLALNRMEIKHRDRPQANLPAIPVTKWIDPDLLQQFKKAEIHPAEAGYKTAEDGMNARFRHHTIWQVCLLMLAGEQWLDWSPRSGSIRRLSDMVDWTNPGVIYAIVDRISPAYKHKLGHLIDMRIIPEVVPVGERPDQFGNAEIQTQYMQALWWFLDFDEIHEQMIAGTLATGNHWLKPYWNPGKQIAGVRECSAFEVMPFPYGIKSPRNADGFIETKAVSLEKLRDEYPEAMEEWDHETDLDEEHATVLASTDRFLSHVTGTGGIRNMIPTREVSRKPSRQFPQGYRIKMLRRRILELQVLGDPDLPLPFYQNTYEIFPGAMYPPGLVQREISKQFVLNKLYSDTVAHIHHQGVGSKLMIPDTVRVNFAELEHPHKPVRYTDEMNNPDNRPWYLQRGNINTDIFALREWTESAMDDSFHLHDPSRGKAPPNIESGIGVKSLQLRDEQPMSPLQKKIGRVWSKVCAHCLTLTARHKRKDRKLFGVDPQYGLPFAIEEFRTSGKSMEPIRVRIRIVPDGPYDKLANRQLLVEMIQYTSGAAVSDMTPQDIRDLIHYGLDPSLYGGKSMDRMVARRENNRFLSGDLTADNVDASIKPWHDDVVHLEEHFAFANHPRYEELAEDVKLAHMSHVRVHLMNLKVARDAQASELPGAEGSEGMPASPNNANADSAVATGE